MRRQTKSKSWREVNNLPFSAVPVVTKPLTVKFDDVAWVKELLARPVGKVEVGS